MSNKKCCLCNNAGKLVKAHIIPKAFFMEIRDEENIPRLVSINPKDYPKKSPVGIYDLNILCEKCEPIFSKVDNYAIEIFLKQFNELFSPLKHSNKITAYEANNINQDLLLRFLIATLWRASVSKHDFYKHVNLGPLEQLAKQTILKPDNPIPKCFSAVLSVWISEKKIAHLKKGILDPYRKRIGGINSYRFFFGEVIADIKADRQPFPSEVQKFALLERNTLIILTKDFLESKDFAIMKKIARNL